MGISSLATAFSRGHHVSIAQEQTLLTAHPLMSSFEVFYLSVGHAVNGYLFSQVNTAFQITFYVGLLTYQENPFVRTPKMSYTFF